VSSSAKIGEMLKSIRLGKKWKLSDLATRSGFTISTLSKMENGKISLTYDKLATISLALGVEIGTLLQTRETTGTLSGTGRRSVMRTGSGEEVETDAYHYLYLATELLNKRFVPMIAYPHARSLEEFGGWVRHSGEEFTFVIEGTVDFYSELYAPVRLEKGDSIYFDSGMGHAYIKVGDAPCSGLTICAGEESSTEHQLEDVLVSMNRREPTVVEQSMASNASSEALKPPAHAASAKAPKVTRAATRRHQKG
jgi:transcriptional regulator with XRE-family HTH domain